MKEGLALLDSMADQELERRRREVEENKHKADLQIAIDKFARMGGRPPSDQEIATLEQFVRERREGLERDAKIGMVKLAELRVQERALAMQRSIGMGNTSANQLAMQRSIGMGNTSANQLAQAHAQQQAYLGLQNQVHMMQAAQQAAQQRFDQTFRGTHRLGPGEYVVQDHSCPTRWAVKNQKHQHMRWVNADGDKLLDRGDRNSR